MIRINPGYRQMESSFFFNRIHAMTEAYRRAHPEKRLLLLGVGDVTKPLSPAVVEAMHRAVADQGKTETFHGYLPETGLDFLKASVAAYYAERNVPLENGEIFISSGAADDLGAIVHLFARENRVLVTEPAYPAYVDTNQMDGREILHLAGTWENGFLPMPEEAPEAELVYLCSPNNPTGAVYTRAQLQQWVDWANERDSIILFDAAYEAFIDDDAVPHSILELPGAKTCAIEICSLSKTSGFTGTRMGYTVVPKELWREGISLNSLWHRDRATRTNGVSYILQRGGQAALSAEGLGQSRENIAFYKENGRILSLALKDRGIDFTGGRNAPYLWLKCPRDRSGWDFFSYLMETAQIVGVPGEGFGPCGAGYFRLSCFGSREDTEEAAVRLRRVL